MSLETGLLNGLRDRLDFLEKSVLESHSYCFFNHGIEVLFAVAALILVHLMLPIRNV